MKGRRIAVVLAACALVGIAAAPVAGSDPATPVAPAVSAPAVPTVVKVEVRYPKRVVVKRTHFTPWGEPTPEQAHIIAAVEAARYGVSLSGLEERIKCESGWQWNNEYTGHYGLGQYLPDTFSRGLGTIGSRKVELRERSEHPALARRIATWSDGSRHSIATWKVRQFIIQIRVGMIPRDPPLEHGWAQVRIMAEALAGRSAVASSEWECHA